MRNSFKRLICAVTALTMCFAFAGCSDPIPDNGGGSGEAGNWQDNMHRDENDFLEDDNRRPSREPFVDDTPLEEEGAKLTPFRFEGEHAKIYGNSGGMDHFCTGKSIEFSPSFSGNVTLCNLGTATLSYTFNSDKKVRSKMLIRMSGQYAESTGAALSGYANMTVNDKPVVNLSATFDPESGEPASGCSAAYFTMVTLETQISLAEGRNVLNITPASSNYLNLDYIEIHTSATVEDKTVSTIADPSSFVNVTKVPTETSTGTIAWDCHATDVKEMVDGECKNKAQRARALPTLTDGIYTRKDVENGTRWTIGMFDEDVVIASSLAYTLTLTEGITFEDGETEKLVTADSKPVLKCTPPEGKVLVGWVDEEGNEYPIEFVMPERDVTIRPKYVSADVTVTLQGGTINGSSTIKAGMGGEIDLTEAVPDTVPEGKVFSGWCELNDRAKIYTDKYTVTGSVTLAPVFDSDNFYSKTNLTGKITPNGHYYSGKEKNCYSVIDNNTSGVVKSSDGTYYEKGSVYRFKGGTADAPAQLPAGAYFVTQEMNTLTNVTEAKTVTVTVENFGKEDITIRFALTTSSGSPAANVYGEETVTIKAGECVTFTYDAPKVHDSIMNYIEVQTAVEELFIGMCQYISDVAA